MRCGLIMDDIYEGGSSPVGTASAREEPGGKLSWTLGEERDYLQGIVNNRERSSPGGEGRREKSSLRDI